MTFHPVFSRLLASLFAIGIASANQGCSSAPGDGAADPGAAQNLQQSEKAAATNILSGFRSLDSVTTGVGAWDLDRVDKDGKSYFVASAFTLPKNGPPTKTPRFDAVVDGDTVYFRPPSENDTLQFSMDQAQAIGADFAVMMDYVAAQPEPASTAGASTSASLHILGGATATCGREAVVAGLRVLGTAVVSVATVAACGAAIFYTAGAAIAGCAAAAPATTALTYASLVQTHNAYACFHACEGHHDGSYCEPYGHLNLTSLSTAAVYTCSSGKTVSIEACKGGCGDDGSSCL